MKRTIALLLALLCAAALFAGCDTDTEPNPSTDNPGSVTDNTPSGGTGNTPSGGTGESTDVANARAFCELVGTAKPLLDGLADDIYDYWAGFVHGEYDTIDEALDLAYEKNATQCERLDALHAQITEKYKEVRDGKLETVTRAVMQAYNEYYTLVMEVTGTFNTYSEALDPTEKALAAALRNLELEL